MRTKPATPPHSDKQKTDDSLKALLYSIADSGERIPAEERERIPRDFAKNIDHYLYGAPKEA